MNCFVIGNGPSLKNTPLDLLKDQVTFATGRINLMYQSTTWRPTYYVLAEKLRNIDEPRLRLDFKEILSGETEGYVQVGMREIMSGRESQHCTFFTTCLCALNGPPEKWHLPELCSYGSSVHVAMQIATQLGYSPIYLLGCDISGGHFTVHYGDSVTEPELWTHAHEIANRSAEVYNATIGGSLEIYPRVDLEELLDV
jgi:hypothetical protein